MAAYLKREKNDSSENFKLVILSSENSIINVSVQSKLGNVSINFPCPY